MNTEPNPENGNAAFPMGYNGPDSSFQQRGMSLRDYFAAAALQGWLSNADLIDIISDKISGNEAKAQISRIVYSIADAMLAERNKP